MEENNNLSKAKENILGTEKIGKLIRKFSIPCIISMLVNSLYNIVDQIFIGWGVGYLGSNKRCRKWNNNSSNYCNYFLYLYSYLFSATFKFIWMH